MANDNSPLSAFEAASGLNTTELRVFLSICLIALLLFAYMWAIRNGFSGMSFHARGDIFDYLKLVLKGAALVIVVIIFFIY